MLKFLSLPLPGTEKGITLGARAIALAILLCIEKSLLNAFVNFDVAQSAQGAGAVARDIQHFGLRFLVTLALALGLLTYLRANGKLAELNGSARGLPIQGGWLAIHVVLMAAQAPLLASMYAGGVPAAHYTTLAVACLVLAIGGTLALLAATAPLQLWYRAARSLGVIWLYAASAAFVATLAIVWIQALWAPTAFITFNLVHWLLTPFIPTLHADTQQLILSTDRFAVQVSDICSGLEGLGLMLAFCCSWLLFFRNEYRFPRALLLIPAGLVLIFALNVLRIASLVVIGHVGYPKVAEIGFHSQAGWIAFNIAACSVAFATRRSSWFSRNAGTRTEASAENPTAAYLVPFLAILAAGMAARAGSDGFETFDSLRLLAGIAALAAYRRRLASLDWRLTWHGPLAGLLVFGLWMVVAQFLISPAEMPGALVTASAGARAIWICGRFLASVLVVPVAEELAYRGFLLRRLVSADFESVPFKSVGWWPLLVSSVVFGLGHGPMSVPAIAAGLVYGGIVIRTGRLGEAVSAHAVTNLLIALAVLIYGQWQLW